MTLNAVSKMPEGALRRMSPSTMARSLGVMLGSIQRSVTSISSGGIDATSAPSMTASSASLACC